MVKSQTPTYDTSRFERRGSLHAPATYWAASDKFRKANCNGCGTAGWKGDLIPDTVYGLCICEACAVHDWMYAEGQTPNDKAEADSMFLTNMLGLIEQAAKQGWWQWLLAPFRRRRCLKYYEAVHEFGGAAFEAAELVSVVSVEDLHAVAAELRKKAASLSAWEHLQIEGDVERRAAELLEQLASEIAA